MAINYVVTKKIDVTGEIPKVLYYAAPKALQKRGQAINADRLAAELAERSSLSPGDVLSVLKQLPDRIIEHLKYGRTVNLDGLGTFMASLTSEGFETPEEVTADKVQVSRVCFKADKRLTQEVKKATFVSLQLQERKKNTGKKEQRDTGEVSE